ncbi:EamA family transporter [Pacificispira sp.]|uniref:EamA family transporter n=1 Tax=Pacificispira sp. TaxID=2888761 RepID=UPI003B51B8A8
MRRPSSYIGADTTSATNIGLIYSASPVLIILLAAAFYGEAVSKLQIAGITLSLLGVIVIVCRADLDVLVNLAFTVGDLWILGGNDRLGGLQRPPAPPAERDGPVHPVRRDDPCRP